MGFPLLGRAARFKTVGTLSQGRGAASAIFAAIGRKTLKLLAIALE
ncbi:hypothetical protein KKY_1965 [Pelagibacterium halotolerans B2]|uniref:Uncharacterized protein n=1 Tax=Pelagibacterium halotolerans (strain DSM 22347 / JCM 15775 / CGMCC 1.7692 / B2) TaxID=1082931 RepID=G4RFD7_PELHB|nr:hypothetical protein KKY_1965 [Pelagibacterium halotolerans B2]